MKIAAKLRIPRMAVLTDAPRNITGMSSTYLRKIHENVGKSDCSFALTKGLVEEFGLQRKPSFVRPILIDDDPVEKMKRERPYIYYGGALFVKDGLAELLESYLSLQPDYDLIISGHGPYESAIGMAAESNPHVIFLGQVDKATHLSYVMGANLCINPRPYQKGLDEVAVPSKMMEYLLLCDYVASYKTSPIEEVFPDDVNWINGDIESFLRRNLDERGNPVGMVRNSAKKKISENWGIEKTGVLLRGYLATSDVFQ